MFAQKVILIDQRNDFWVLGIDTSAYTTSVASVSHFSCHQERQVLNVPLGQRGLRSSDAVFQHVTNLPILIEQLMSHHPDHALALVAASAAPRPTPDSYLPPFQAGLAVARSLASLCHVPLLQTSHQEGHIRAGLQASGMPSVNHFLALHISGGTTELLEVTAHPGRFTITELGGSDDLYAGQFVDRVGVRLGLRFPSGPQFEELVLTSHEAVELPWSRPRYRDGRWWTSFSGPESAAQRAIDQGAEAGQVAKGVIESIARSLAALILLAPKGLEVLVVGGVAANTHLRQVLGRLLTPQGIRLWYADPQWSRDNAVGVAYLGWDSLTYKGRQNCEHELKR